MLHHTFLLLLALQILSSGDSWNISQKRRQKREWLIPTKKITENVDYSDDPVIGRIRSDIDDKAQLRYTLRGPGANQPPVGYFMVEEYKGLVRVTQPMDREEMQVYTLVGTGWFTNNSIAEDNIKMRIIVEDQNDNAPVFVQPEECAIFEGSPVGTVVTQVVATDADEPNTLHTKIAYSIVKQEPSNGKLFFAINKDSGRITVEHPALDREEHSSYTLTVQAADMYGSAGGNSATATVSIDILDINDNVPTLEKDEFSASVDENVAHIEVLRIQALDLDEEWTDNWLVVFTIVLGNEDGLFSIETDPRTNVGVLYLNKPVDFETASNLNLNLVITNKAVVGAPLANGGGGASGSSSGTGGAAGASGALGSGGSPGASGSGGSHGASGSGGSAGASGSGGSPGASGSGGSPGVSGAGSVSGTVFGVSKLKTYSVKISVQNKPESPKFKPKVKPITISENGKLSVPVVIGSFLAIEEDTGDPATNVKYAKGYDPDNWISINMDTAEIKLNKVPDRESPFVVNGTYFAKILSITDELHSQTATGTIALQVEDTNDNCPTILDKVQTICSDSKIVNVTAEDTDGNPNGAPLEFRLIEEKTRGKWKIQTLNDVSASLLAEEPLWPGFYQIAMEIKDMQGLACPEEQVVHVEVCTCSDGTVCGSKMEAVVDSTSPKFGLSGLSFLVLGILPLIVALLLLISCICGSGGKDFIEMPFETKQHLVPYCTEGRGEDKDVLLMCPTLKIIHEGEYETSHILRKESTMTSNYQGDGMKVFNLNQTLYDGNKMAGVEMENGFYYDSAGAEIDKSAWCEEHEDLDDAIFEQYLFQKSRHLSGADSPKEELTCFHFEGEGSIAGSIGSCSFNESFDDLEFLDNMETKFISLAEVCGYRQTQSVPKADSGACVKTMEMSPTTIATSSDHINPTALPSPSEITLKSSTVQAVPYQQVVIQEPLYYEINQSMPSNVMFSESMIGHSVYLINNTQEPERILIPGNAQTLTRSGNDQGILANNIIANSVVYSDSGPHSPVMISGGLAEVNPSVIQNLSPASNLVVMPQNLDGMDSLQMVRIPAGSVVPGDNAHGGLIFLEGSVGEGHFTMSPQQFLPPTAHELDGPIQLITRSTSCGQNNGQRPSNTDRTAHGHVNREPLVRSPLSHLSQESEESGQSRVFEGSGGGKSLLVASPGESPLYMIAGKPNLQSVPQVAAGQINNNNNNQLLVSGPALTASSLREPRRRRSSVLESPVLAAVSGQLPVAMSAGNPNLVSMPQVVTGHLSSLLVTGVTPSAKTTGRRTSLK